MIRIQGEVTGLKEAILRLGLLPNEVRKASKYARQETLKFLREESVKRAEEVYYIKVSAVRKAIKIRNNKSGAKFIVRGRRLSLAEYALTPKKPTKKRVPLSGAVRKAGGLKPLSSAFLMKTKTGKKYIPMRRKGRARLPLEPLMAPAIPQLVERVMPDLQEQAQEVLQRTFWEKVYSFMNSRGEL